MLVTKLDGSRWATLRGFSSNPKGLIEYMTGQRTITLGESCTGDHFCAELHDPQLQITGAKGWTPTTSERGLYLHVRGGGVWIGDNTDAGDGQADRHPSGAYQAGYNNAASGFNLHIGYRQNGIQFRGSSFVGNNATPPSDSVAGGTIYVRLADTEAVTYLPSGCDGSYKGSQYIYATRTEAQRACIDYGCAGLADKSQVRGDGLVRCFGRRQERTSASGYT